MQTAEQLFSESMRHTKAMIYYKPGKAWIWGGLKVGPDEVINELEKQGVNITVRTLQNWVNQGLIPKPARGRKGTGGSWADYSPETIPEALTIQLLRDVYRFMLAEISEARKNYLEGVYNWRSVLWFDLRYTLTQGYDYSSVRIAAQKHYDDGLFPLLLGKQFREWLQTEIEPKQDH